MGTRIRRISTMVVAFAVAGLVGSPASADEPGLQGRDDIYMQTSFESADWQDAWTNIGHAENIDVIEGDGAFRGDRHLRISVDEGAHYGGGLSYYFEEETGQEPEAVYFRYALRFGPTWIAYRNGKLPGFGGTYDRAGWGGRVSNGENGWSARMRFAEPNSGRQMGNTALSYYVYHADMSGTYGDPLCCFDSPAVGEDGGLGRGEWHQIEGYVEMNTPNGDASTEGARDGVLRAWVDGELAIEKTGYRFRDVADLKVERIWANIYYGGSWTAPQDMYLELDNVVIADNYIGPYDEEPPRERVGPQFSDVPHFGSRENYAFNTADRWWVVDEDGDKRLYLRTSGYEAPGRNLLGEWALAEDRTFGDFEMTASVKTGESLSANESADWALVFGWQNPDNYLYVLGNPTADNSAVIHVEEGEASTVARADEALVPDEQWHDVRVRHEASTTGELTVELDGTTVLTAQFDERIEGRVGVGSINDSSFFDDIAFQAIDEGDAGADTGESAEGSDAGPPLEDTGSGVGGDTSADRGEDGSGQSGADESDGGGSGDAGGSTSIVGGSQGCSCGSAGGRHVPPILWMLFVVSLIGVRRAVSLRSGEKAR